MNDECKHKDVPWGRWRMSWRGRSGWPADAEAVAPAEAVVKPVLVVEKSARFLDDDDIAAEEAAMAEVAIAAPVAEKPKHRERVIPALLRERGLAA